MSATNDTSRGLSGRGRGRKRPAAEPTTTTPDTDAEPVVLDVAARTPGVEADLTTVSANPDPVTAPVLSDVVLDEPDFGETAALPGIEPEVPIATTLPDGSAIAGGLAGMTVGSITIDTEPDHFGVGGADDGGLAAIADVVNGGGTTGTTTPTAAGDFGSGSLAPLPGMSDKGVTTGEISEWWDNTAKDLGENLDAVKTTVTELPGLIADKANEVWNDAVEVVEDMAEWGGNVGGWITNPGEEGTEYGNPDADPILAAPSQVVAQIIATGVDPTTTNPGVVDDAEPITSDDLAGAGPVGGLNVPVNPLVIDSAEEAGVTSGGDLGIRLGALGPDVVGPNDPILGGGEPITADDLTAPPGAGNPIAGGEDEDLEDLEIQRLTPRSGLSTLGGEEGTFGSVQPLTSETDPHAILSPGEPLSAAPEVALDDMTAVPMAYSEPVDLFANQPIDQPGGEPAVMEWNADD